MEEKLNFTEENDMSITSLDESLGILHPNFLHDCSLVNVSIPIVTITEGTLELLSFSNTTLETPNTAFIISSSDKINDDLFLDSVFIEGRNLATKIADGSLCMDSPDYGVLDSTSEPNWPDFDEINTHVNSPKSNNVFKTIDKLIPKVKELQLESSDNNITKFNNNFQISTCDSNSSTSNNIKQMLQNLSDILNCTDRSEEQKSQGRLILNMLADMLNNSVDVDSDDYRHSSVEHKSLQKNLPAVEINEPINSKDSTLPKQINSSTNINDARLKRPSSIEIAVSKFKSKSTSYDVKKGPLKALVPIEQMKKSSIITPGKVENKKTTLSVKTSTPVYESKVGFATSTPNQSPISESASRKSKPIRATPVETTDKKLYVKTRSNSEASIQLLKKSRKNSITSPKVNNSIPVRRNSFSEGMTVKELKPKRSNTSLGKETENISGLHKFSKNILKLSNSNPTKNILGDHNVNKVHSISDKSKSFKMKKNKENICS